MSLHHRSSFFDIDYQLNKIHKLNNFLVRLNALVNWTIFLAPLSTLRHQRNPSKGGRPPFDLLLMFKILILKTLYNLSDENTEFLIRDRLSFREFLGLNLSDRVPDARTIWLFGELLKEQNMERSLFDLFYEELARHGIEVKRGCVMDGTFIDVPKQHNCCEENTQTKKGHISEQLVFEPEV
ncbi:MAG: transposase [Planctomycetaceae bacterium]|jgi:hypothetical protein|nr:transposase [Planctomycetaceae bacterium]